MIILGIVVLLVFHYKIALFRFLFELYWGLWHLGGGVYIAGDPSGYYLFHDVWHMASDGVHRFEGFEVELGGLWLLQTYIMKRYERFILLLREYHGAFSKNLGDFCILGGIISPYLTTTMACTGLNTCYKIQNILCTSVPGSQRGREKSLTDS